MIVTFDGLTLPASFPSPDHSFITVIFLVASSISVSTGASISLPFAITEFFNIVPATTVVFTVALNVIFTVLPGSMSTFQAITFPFTVPFSVQLTVFSSSPASVIKFTVVVSKIVSSNLSFTSILFNFLSVLFVTVITYVTSSPCATVSFPVFLTSISSVFASMLAA